jgi:hypothetical protein
MMYKLNVGSLFHHHGSRDGPPCLAKFMMFGRNGSHNYSNIVFYVSVNTIILQLVFAHEEYMFPICASLWVVYTY